MASAATDFLPNALRFELELELELGRNYRSSPPVQTGLATLKALPSDKLERRVRLDQHPKCGNGDSSSTMGLDSNITTVATVESGPDISWIPDEAKFQTRTKRLESSRKTNAALPAGFPDRVVGPRVWSREDFASDDGALFLALTSDDIVEVEAAVQEFNGR